MLCCFFAYCCSVATFSLFCCEGNMGFLKKIPIHPFFYVLIIYFLISGQIIIFLNFITALFFHEFGHFFVSKKLGYTLEKFFIAPYGACLDYKEKQFERRDEIWIALAGPVSNIIIALFFIALWWIFPMIYSSTLMFVEQNIMLATFNLLPAFPLDGGRVCLAAISNKFGRDKSFKFIKGVNLMCSFVFACMFFASFFISFNPTFALATVFLLSGFFQGEFASNYKNSFLLEKRVSSFTKPKIVLVKDELCFNDLLKKIDRDTYTIFNIISKCGELVTLTEQQVIDVCVKIDGKQKLSRLFYD